MANPDCVHFLPRPLNGYVQQYLSEDERFLQNGLHRRMGHASRSTNPRHQGQSRARFVRVQYLHVLLDEQ